MKQYHDLLQKVLSEGIESSDRTGTGTLSLFGEKMEFDLNEGFPLLTTKKLSFKNIATELIWFLKGDTNAKYLDDMNNTIWKEWTNEDNDLPHTYAKQWRHFGGLDSEYTVDQIANVIKNIKENPYGRRHIVSAWNPLTVDHAALPPCHMFFQFYVRDNKLSLLFYMRSNDMFLGNPYNIASYALLCHIVAFLTGFEVGKLVYMCGDCHLYTNHIEQAKELLSRDYTKYKLPTLKIRDNLNSIDDIELFHLKLDDYESYPSISAEVAV